MNKFYVIVPVVLLAVFTFFYRGAVNDLEAREARMKQEATAKADAEKAHQKEIERKAQEDADKRQKERDAEDKAKADKKERDYQNAMKQLKDEADGYVAETARLKKEASDIEAQIAQTRAAKEKSARDSLDLAKQVELSKISRRNAELEIQRMVEMVGNKANALAAMPPPPPAPPKS